MNENCMIHSNLIQGTDEWLKTRAGKCTSSERGLFAAKNGFDSYLILKEAELHMELFEEGYVSAAMNNGTELEPIARQLFEEKNLVEVTEVGFISRQDINCGWSPDGLIKDSEGNIISAIEIKCREATGHYGVLKKGLDAATYNQMQFAMAITDIEYMWYVGYNPNFKAEYRLITIKVDRSDELATQIKALLLKVKSEIGL